MSDLQSYFEKNSVEVFLGYTRTLIALLSAQGRFLDWNPAFNELKSTLPSGDYLQDFLVVSSRAVFNEMGWKEKPCQLSLVLIPEVGGEEINCLLQSLSDGKILFCAEAPRVLRDDEINRLTDQLVQARRTIMIKEVELEAVLAQADEISNTDALTFISNRRRIISDLQREVIRCDRYPKALTIFMLDIDHFKNINDAYGHAAGDQVLRALAGALQANIRQTHFLGRYGGEEFLLILPGTSKDSSIVLADRLLETTRSLNLNLATEHEVHITISIGIAQYHIGRESWDGVLKRADNALFDSKKSGRNRRTISK